MIESWGEPPASLVGRLSEGAELLHAALVRNYPELTLAEVKEGLDLASFPAVLAQLLEVSGLTEAPPGGTAGGERPDWGYLYARVISLTGWTWEYVGQHLTLPRLYEMQRYWEQHPPVGDLVAAYLGYQAPKHPKPQTENRPLWLARGADGRLRQRRRQD